MGFRYFNGSKSNNMEMPGNVRTLFYRDAYIFRSIFENYTSDVNPGSCRSFLIQIIILFMTWKDLLRQLKQINRAY